jgi:hypothetical protein
MFINEGHGRLGNPFHSLLRFETESTLQMADYACKMFRVQ